MSISKNMGLSTESNCYLTCLYTNKFVFTFKLDKQGGYLQHIRELFSFSNMRVEV